MLSSTLLTRRLAILEPFLVFGMIMQYIWGLRSHHPHEWLLILGLILFSHRVHRERAKTIGFHAIHWQACWNEYSPLLALVALCMLAGGTLLQTTRPSDSTARWWPGWLTFRGDYFSSTC